jgi:hypothetical protein
MPEVGIKPAGVPHLYEVNYPSQGQYGYLVKLTRHRKKIYKVFNFNKYGSSAECRAAAEGHARQVDLEFPCLSRRERSELRRSHFKEGTVGVRRVQRRINGRLIPYWQASWSPEPGRVARKIFSVEKHGDETARTLALAAREAALGALDDILPRQNLPVPVPAPVAPEPVPVEEFFGFNLDVSLL